MKRNERGRLLGKETIARKRKKVARPGARHRPALVKKNCCYTLVWTERAGRRHLYKLIVADHLGSRIARCREGGNFTVCLQPLHCNKEEGSFFVN